MQQECKPKDTWIRCKMADFWACSPMHKKHKIILCFINKYILRMLTIAIFQYYNKVNVSKVSDSVLLL